MKRTQPGFSCRTDVTTTLSYTEEFMALSMPAKCPGPAAVKQTEALQLAKGHLC